MILVCVGWVGVVITGVLVWAIAGMVDVIICGIPKAKINASPRDVRINVTGDDIKLSSTIYLFLISFFSVLSLTESVSDSFLKKYLRLSS
jgi:hypothetical protein